MRTNTATDPLSAKKKNTTKLVVETGKSAKRRTRKEDTRRRRGRPDWNWTAVAVQKSGVERSGVESSRVESSGMEWTAAAVDVVSGDSDRGDMRMGSALGSRLAIRTARANAESRGIFERIASRELRSKFELVRFARSSCSQY